ncbi:MAG TPA: type II toxin-antitoxin system RelE/ParE family toxin [Nitrosopumilaceae archaeon]|nr:type II toxin-antitoxin system RelE/ParE family toxin [Nitrosopumilaceae archaeon]
MVYKIIVTDTAKKQLKKLDRQTAKRIDKKLREISNDPFLYVTKLVGLEFYKLRVGNYRVLMTIQQNNLIIMVVEISHRSNVYK